MGDVDRQPKRHINIRVTRAPNPDLCQYFVGLNESRKKDEGAGAFLFGLVFPRCRLLIERHGAPRTTGNSPGIAAWP